MSKLELTTYEPKLTDPRVQRRIASVLAWCALRLDPHSPEAVHHDELRRVFGTATNPLTAWLRANLLIQTGTYLPRAKSFSYLLNEPGVEKLRALCNRRMIATSAVDLTEIYPELVDLTFTYTEKSDRYWHPLQNIKRDRKTLFWEPYLPFNYDIEAAAPTMLVQLAKKLGLHRLLGAAIDDYLANKEAYRLHVVSLTGCSPVDAKHLINSLFNGARLSRSEFTAAYRLVGSDYAAMTLLMQDPRIRALRAHIKQMWRAIGRGQDVSQSKAKWGVYFKLERSVMDAITEELRSSGIKHFTEHDGFRADREVEVEKLQRAVKAKTKLEITLTRNEGELKSARHH